MIATKVTVALEDDLAGGPADEAVRFAFGGTECETDLSKKNAQAFRKQLSSHRSLTAPAGSARDGSYAAKPRPAALVVSAPIRRRL